MNYPHFCFVPYHLHSLFVRPSLIVPNHVVVVMEATPSFPSPLLNSSAHPHLYTSQTSRMVVIHLILNGFVLLVVCLSPRPLLLFFINKIIHHHQRRRCFLLKIVISSLLFFVHPNLLSGVVGAHRNRGSIMIAIIILRWWFLFTSSPLVNV